MMRVCISAFLFIIIWLSTVAVTRLHAQSDNYWFNAGIGAGSSGTAGILSGSYQFGLNLISIRSASTFELFGDDYWDMGILYGFATSAEIVHASFAAGVAVSGGSEVVSGSGFFGRQYNKLPVTTGLPLELQFFTRPGKFIGFGLYGFANINNQHSFGGAALALQVGKIR